MRTYTLPAALGTLAVVLGATLAQADAPKQDCVIDVADRVGHCFSDYRAAIAFATEGAIVDAPRNAHEAVGEPMFHAKMARLATGIRTGAGGGSVHSGLSAAATVANNPVIGATLFTGTNYTGQSDTLRIPKPCVKDGKYDYSFKLGTIGRNAESVQPWADCWIWLHSGASLDSPRQGPFKEDTPDLGDWKRRAVMLGLS